MSTTAWRFSGTEGADAAVLRLKQLDGQDLIDVQDVTVIRWPHYATAPQAQEHVTAEGSKASSFAKKLTKAGIDGTMRKRILIDNPAQFFGLNAEADITETPAAV